MTSRAGVGLGVVTRSKSFASISNQVQLPGYARGDAALFYNLAPGIEAQVNVENLLGAERPLSFTADQLNRRKGRIEKSRNRNSVLREQLYGNGCPA